MWLGMKWQCKLIGAPPPPQKKKKEEEEEEEEEGLCQYIGNKSGLP